MKALVWLNIALLLVLPACSDDGTAEDLGLDTAGDLGEDPVEDPTDDPDLGTEPDLQPGADLDADDADGGVGTIDGRPISELYGRILFNEVLTDGTVEGDPNGDGDADPVEDQFVELVSTAESALDLQGFTLVESHLPALPRHTFGAGFSLEPGHAVVIFGGGDAPDASEGATFFTANAADPGIPFGLHLSMPSDHILLLDDAGAVVARFCYGEAEGECSLEPAADESLTRSPDLVGSFVPHTDAEGSAGVAFSPGTRLDGTAF
ncbi:MAG: lamin tail domain-containing protein [Bradymonadales bacterium]|nr:lamin tail domain-containing protein [Bradymonadales bacterium]